MNWINRIFKLTDKVTLPEFWGGFTPFSMYNFGGANLECFINDAYGCNPFVYMVVDKIADVASALPHYTVDAEGLKTDGAKFEELVQSLRIDFMGNEVVDCSQKNAYHQICTSLLVTGNVFIWIKSGGNAINILLPQYVTINTENGTGAGEVTYYSYSDGTKEYKNIPKEEILHIKYPNLIEETNWGLSPLYANIYAIETSNNAFEAMAWMLKNKGTSGILSSKDANMPATPSQTREMTEAFKKSAGGASKFQQVTVTSGAYDYTPLSMNANDLKSLDSNMAMLRVICSVYGISSQLFNDPVNSTYNNVSEAKKAMYSEVIMPLVDLIDSCLTDFIYRYIEKNESLSLFTDFSGVKELAADTKTEVDTVLQLVGSGIITAEEARTMLIEKGVINEE